jgi:hypothetical protein
LDRDSAHFLGNCAAVSAASSLDAALADLHYFTGAQQWPCEILPPNPLERMAGYRFWPQHGISINDRVHLFYLGIRQVDQASTWGFQVVGSGMALLDAESGQCDRLPSDRDWRWWPELGPDLHLGVQVLRDGETIYVFSSHCSGPYSFVRLARAPVGRLTDPGAYEHLVSDEPSWSAEVQDGSDLVACSREYSVSFNPYLSAYLMVYVDGYAKKLLYRTAPAPWGPYSDACSVGVVPHRRQAELISLGFEHPRFATDDGRTVFISYCQPQFTQNSLVAIRFA